MKTNDIDAAQIEAAARALLDDRVAAVRVLATTRQRQHDATAALAAAEREDADAWATALRSGWTEDQLRKVGLQPPKRRLPGRPRARPADASSSPANPETPAAMSGPAAQKEDRR